MPDTERPDDERPLEWPAFLLLDPADPEVGRRRFGGCRQRRR